MARFKFFFGGLIVFVIYKILTKTWRWEIEPPPWLGDSKSKKGFDVVRGVWSRPNESETPAPVVLAHWHEDEWVLIGAFANSGMHVLVSHSKDGGLMTQFLKFLGYEVCRGSSSRGGAAGLISLIRNVRNSPRPLTSLAVDGPRGPRHEPKEGILKLAEKLEAPIYVMGARASRCWFFNKSWSGAYIPKPFAKVWVKFGGPFYGLDVEKLKLYLQESKIHNPK